MTKTVISTTHAPAAVGPYSAGIDCGETVYLSGQLGLDPATGELAEGVEAQARQALANRGCAARGRWTHLCKRGQDHRPFGGYQRLCRGERRVCRGLPRALPGAQLLRCRCASQGRLGGD